jgi:hypothetical protein
MSVRGILVWIVVVGFALPALAGPTRYNPRRAGHPLRVAAYALHPFGVILDTLIFHPAWWVGTHEPFKTLFGVQAQSDDYVDVQMAEVEPLPLEPSEDEMAEPEAEEPGMTAPESSEPDQD